MGKGQRGIFDAIRDFDDAMTNETLLQHCRHFLYTLSNVSNGLFKKIFVLN